MEYLYPVGWTILAVALIVYGANLFRRKCPEVPDLMPAVTLLLRAADYFDAIVDDEADELRRAFRCEAQRLEALQREGK